MKRFVLNRVVEGNIITGYEIELEGNTREEVIDDYLYFLQTAEGIENPECDCVQNDWEKEE